MLKEESETFERINKTNEMQKKIFSDFEKILRESGNMNNIYDNYNENNIEENEQETHLNNNDNSNQILENESNNNKYEININEKYE